MFAMAIVVGSEREALEAAERWGVHGTVIQPRNALAPMLLSAIVAGGAATMLRVPLRDAAALARWWQDSERARGEAVARVMSDDESVRLAHEAGALFFVTWKPEARDSDRHYPCAGCGAIVGMNEDGTLSPIGHADGCPMPKAGIARILPRGGEDEDDGAFRGYR